MLIQFCLLWARPGKPTSKAFKDAHAAGLFSEYVGRLSQFTKCETIAAPKNGAVVASGAQIWLCEALPRGKELSSEQLAEKVEALQSSGLRSLQIVIGGPDGISEGVRVHTKPNFTWSFGRMTLPHELAAIVASEQMYRAWTINQKLPYHIGH
jgi:23S rRNA (pseudouridine1915-N3)-methyltransferase